MSLMTNPVALAPAQWMDLGAGPLTVSAHGSEWASVLLVVSDTQPPGALIDGEPLRGTRFFGGPTHVWALALGQPARVVVTAPDSGAAAGGASAGGALTAGEAHIGEIGGNSAVVAASFTRPANTTAYAIGQLVANTTTVASVTPLALSVARKTGGTGRITRARLTKSGPSLTNASFRIHLHRAAPTPSNGDGGTWLTTESTYVGSLDVIMDKAFVDGAKGIGVPSTGAYITFDTSGSTNLFALVEARAAYTPLSGELFTLALEADRD